jgi:hypothetical protein
LPTSPCHEVPPGTARAARASSSGVRHNSSEGRIPLFYVAEVYVYNIYYADESYTDS